MSEECCTKVDLIMQFMSGDFVEMVLLGTVWVY
jgi:hypothetical protein